MTSELRSVLLELARRQDDLAAHEAAATPYWAPCRSSVLGRRLVAVDADYEAVRSWERSLLTLVTVVGVWGWVAGLSQLHVLKATGCCRPRNDAATASPESVRVASKAVVAVDACASVAGAIRARSEGFE